MAPGWIRRLDGMIAGFALACLLGSGVGSTASCATGALPAFGPYLAIGSLAIDYTGREHSRRPWPGSRPLSLRRSPGQFLPRPPSFPGNPVKNRPGDSEKETLEYCSSTRNEVKSTPPARANRP